MTPALGLLIVCAASWLVVETLWQTAILVRRLYRCVRRWWLLSKIGRGPGPFTEAEKEAAVALIMDALAEAKDVEKHGP